jgi:hypothetical protein
VGTTLTPADAQEEEDEEASQAYHDHEEPVKDDELCIGLVVPLEVLGRDHGAVIYTTVPPGSLLKGQVSISCDCDPPALIVVSQGHSIALLGGHHPYGAHTVLALYIGVVARVASCQLGIDLVVHTGWGEGIGDAIPAERLVLPDYNGCREGGSHLVGAGQGHRLEQNHHMVGV